MLFTYGGQRNPLESLCYFPESELVSNLTFVFQNLTIESFMN